MEISKGASVPVYIRKGRTPDDVQNDPKFFNNRLDHRDSCAWGGLTATPANAALTEGPAASSSQSAQTVNGLSQSTINKADQFVHRSGSTYSFDAANARSVLSSSETSQVQSAVDNWNTNLQENQSSAQTRAGETRGAPDLVKGKHGYIKAHWWGLEIHVDNWLAGKIQNGTATGSAIAAGVGLASSETGAGGIAGGIVSAALAASAGVQGLCRDEKGEATYYAPISPTPTIVCNPLA